MGWRWRSAAGGRYLLAWLPAVIAELVDAGAEGGVALKVAHEDEDMQELGSEAEELGGAGMEKLAERVAGALVLGREGGPVCVEAGVEMVGSTVGATVSCSTVDVTVACTLVLGAERGLAQVGMKSVGALVLGSVEVVGLKGGWVGAAGGCAAVVLLVGGVEGGWRAGMVPVDASAVVGAVGAGLGGGCVSREGAGGGGSCVCWCVCWGQGNCALNVLGEKYARVHMCLSK